MPTTVTDSQPDTETSFGIQRAATSPIITLVKLTNNRHATKRDN